MPENRPRRALTWLLTVVGLAAALGFLGARATIPGDGAPVGFYSGSWTGDGVHVQPPAGAATGLAAGDLVTGVAGRPLAAWLDDVADPGLDRSALDAATIPYTVERAGVRLDTTVTLRREDLGGRLLDFWSVLLFTAVLQGVAVFVLVRRPEASAAVALALAAVGVTGSTIPWLLGVEVGDIVRGWPLLLYALTTSGLYILVWPAGLLHLPLAMTSAVAPSARALRLAYGVPLLGYAAALIASRIAAGSTLAWIGTWGAAQGAVILPTALAGIVLTVRRYRAAPQPVRDRTKWVALAGLVAIGVSLALLFIPQLVLGSPLIPWSALGIVALPLPLGVAAAVVRRGLFDIEVVVNRALVYGGLTAAIAGIYVVAVSVLGTVVGAGSGPSSSLLATGLAAVAALPVRDGLQRLVNRVMYGDRDDPYRALIRLGRRLEGTLDPREAPAVVVRTIAESLRLPWVALRIGAGGGDATREIAHGSRPPGDPVVVPVVYGAEVVGDLLVAPRSASEPLSPADHALLEDLARQAGPSVHATALTLDLAESRGRLVAAREEERRRIRRDLHDGLGPTLAAIGLRAELAADLVGDTPAAEQVLGELRGEVRGALADIRRLVDALRPPALDELGLVGALRAQAARLAPVPAVTVEADGPVPELAAAVEVAAYRIAVEAMTNAVRHSGGRTCLVRVRVVDPSDPAGPGGPGESGGEAGGASGGAPGRVLEIEVTDDGRGLPEQLRPGIGLVSMRERAAEVGGSCTVAGGATGGTRVLARLPLNALPVPAPSAGSDEIGSEEAAHG